MNIASPRVGILVVLFLGGTFWGAVGHASAADTPEYIQPIPDQTSSPAKPVADGQPAPMVQGEPPVAAADEGPCGDCCMPVCSPPGRFWMRADYLMWWTSGMNLPPLVTTGTTTSPNSTVLFGNDLVNDGGHSGFRTTLGMWLDCRHTWDVEFDYLNLGGQSSGFSEFSAGTPILTRPFFNMQTNQQDAELVAFPNVASGSISVLAKDYFQSAGVSMSYNLCSCDSCCESCDSCADPCANCDVPKLNCCRTDLVVGFRYYNLSDSVLIHELPQNANPFALFNIQDSFMPATTSMGASSACETSSSAAAGRWRF